MDIVQSKARRVSIRNTETHGSIISGTQDVTNGGEPMSFADSLLKPLQQAPVLGKDGEEKALPRDWNNPRMSERGGQREKQRERWKWKVIERKKILKGGTERDIGYMKEEKALLWWLWITMTTLLYPKCFYVLLLSAGSRQRTKATPSLPRYQQYLNYHHFPQGLCSYTASSFPTAGNSTAVIGLDIDRCYWKSNVVWERNMLRQKMTFGFFRHEIESTTLMATNVLKSVGFGTGSNISYGWY